MGHLQATLSKLLTYCVLRSTQPPTLSETENEYSSLQATGEGLVWLIVAVVCLLAANRGSNCSLMLAMDDRIVRCTISLAHANQLPLPRL